MISLRRVNKNDCILMFQWANDSEVRKNSFSSKKIELENHKRWFESKLNDNRCKMFVAMNDKTEVGQIRVDLDGQAGIISYSIDANHRGYGIGTEILNLIKLEFQDIKLIGYVKKENIASIKAFERAVYEKIEYDDFIEFVYKPNCIRG